MKFQNYISCLHFYDGFLRLICMYVFLKVFNKYYELLCRMIIFNSYPKQKWLRLSAA